LNKTAPAQTGKTQRKGKTGKNEKKSAGVIYKIVFINNKIEADLTEKPNISILEITEKRSRSAENNRPRNRTKV
jgi:hypothetical protein